MIKRHRRQQTFRIQTFGCKANRYDSQRLAEALLALGWRQARPDQHPAVVLINTCTVTARCDRKCRQAISHALRESPATRLFVTGCYATAFPQELGSIGGLAGVYGRAQWKEMLHAIAGDGAACEALLAGDFGIRGFCGRARALLKIQEGCDFFCTYCIIPYVRGRPRSSPLAQVRAEAERLAGAGFREIVLTGIHLGVYGRDLDDGTDLADAVLAVAEVGSLQRVRLSSIKADEVDDELLAAMQHPSVCPHLHLPLQSGDDEVLRRMKRGYTAGAFLHTVEKARAVLDNPAITTDVMVGFPGESDEAFQNTLDVCRKAAFSRIHIFPFSARPGTSAASFPGQVGQRVVKERCRRLGKIARALAREWAASFVGRQVRVLLEEEDKEGHLLGYTDRYVRALVDSPRSYIGKTAQVRCTGSQGGTLLAELA